MQGENSVPLLKRIWQRITGPNVPQDPSLPQDTIPSQERYRRWNLCELQAIEGMLNRNGFSLKRFKSILDFGCGYGRVTRYLFELAPDAKIYGCEVNSNLVEQCKRSLPAGNFIVNQPTPPLDFPDAAFDFIYSWSLFTHLSEPNHIAWLQELACKLKPGGVMLHTTHGYECLKRMAVFNPERLIKHEIPCPLEEFVSTSLCYHYAFESQFPEYGYTIISKDYIMKNWASYSGINLVDYSEGVYEKNPEGCHDFVLLAKGTK